jgi:hypothetical protein
MGHRRPRRLRRRGDPVSDTVSRAEAAALLGLSTGSVRYAMRSHGIDPVARGRYLVDDVQRVATARAQRAEPKVTPQERHARRRTQVAASKRRGREQLAANPDDARHGTANGYSHGCRCERCRSGHYAATLEQLAADPTDRRHGTITGYVYGCRCERCRDARSAKSRDVRAAPPAGAPHGTTTRYGYGCRCDACRAARQTYQKDYIARRVAEGRVPHGTTTGYYSCGCRCEQCQSARKDRTRVRRGEQG